MAKRADIRIGVSGWTYASWRGAFYSEALPRTQELAHASCAFRAIEINSTFYRMQRPETFIRWASETPDDFLFAVKGSRYITHVRRLKDFEVPLANFLASGVLALADKLGPLLWQLPPSFRYDRDRLEAFFERLPRDTTAAMSFARCHHDERVAGRVFTGTVARRPLRHALEVRHESFRDSDFIALLRRHGIALVCADAVKWPLLMDLTTDFVYCRLHGSRDLYRSKYEAEELDRWAERVVAWATGEGMRDGVFASGRPGPKRRRDVFVFFDNTDKQMAPADARALQDRVDEDLATHRRQSCSRNAARLSRCRARRGRR